jgi:hypothetical protein
MRNRTELYHLRSSETSLLNEMTKTSINTPTSQNMPNTKQICFGTVTWNVHTNNPFHKQVFWQSWQSYSKYLQCIKKIRAPKSDGNLTQFLHAFNVILSHTHTKTVLYALTPSEFWVWSIPGNKEEHIIQFWNCTPHFFKYIMNTVCWHKLQTSSLKCQMWNTDPDAETCIMNKTKLTF